VLFKAASAHNLPVMMQAISLGADKNWENSDNLNRTPLHQAILAVSCD
jgi:Arf-GAP with coiled-coil, ANK repeat and PH domain-containing protein